MKQKIKSLIILAVLSCIVFGSIGASAASFNFNGTLNNRVLDGGSNGKYYSVKKDKKVTMAGSARLLSKDNAVSQSATTTYVYLIRGSKGGSGTTVCNTTVTVSKSTKNFSCSGTPNKDGDAYVYIKKNTDDGYNLSFSGTIKY